jgi:hypothetical protein
VDTSAVMELQAAIFIILGSMILAIVPLLTDASIAD